MDDLIPCRFINVHLLNLLDGSPHEIPLKRVLTLNWEDYRHLSVKKVEISGSRIALIIGATSSPVARRNHWELVVWDWKTGEVVGGLFPVRNCLSNHNPGTSTLCC